MEVVLFLGFVVLLILIIQNKSDQRSQHLELKNHLSRLYNQLAELTEHLKNPGTEKNEPAVVPEEKIPEPEEAPVITPDIIRQLEQNIPSPRPWEIDPDELKETITPPKPEEKIVRESLVQKWFRNNPDLEKFIGENLFNKIGIAVLVFGIGFFVKYAIDKDWINEYGRVAIGLGCGSLLIGLAHFLRKTYRGFSSVLAGGGIAVYYFTIALAFHEYHIFSQTTAFILMVVITAFSVFIAILYDRIELAVISATGGFLAPFLVSTGDGNYITLFSYLIILNIGLLAVSYFKKWSLVNIIALFATILIYGAWLTDIMFWKKHLPVQNALLFASAFYLLFLGMNMIHNIAGKKRFTSFDFFILLLINFAYYTAGMCILSAPENHDMRGLFTISMGVINLVLAFYFFRAKSTDRNLLYLLIGLTLTYLSLSAPVQLEGSSITLFWSAEIVLLLWLFGRSRIALFKLASVIIALCLMLSLMIDWAYASNLNSYDLPLIFTNMKGIVTNVVAIIALFFYDYLLLKEDASSNFLLGISFKFTRIFVKCAAFLLVFVTGIFCINLYFAPAADLVSANIYHSLFTYILIAFLYSFIIRSSNEKTGWLRVCLLIAAFIFYISSTGLINNLIYGMIDHRYSWVQVMIHFAGILMFLYLFYLEILRIRKSTGPKAGALKFFTWLFVFMIVVVLSNETENIYLLMFGSAANPALANEQFDKAGLTIVWALCSFYLIFTGIRKRYKTLRIIGLCLFAISLIKLFLFDIRNINPGGKIAAFILLGVLLLLVSFMYQRLKKILIDDGKK